MLVTAELSGHEPAYLALETEASRPYTSFVYEDGAHAARIQRLLFDHDVGEFARTFARVALIDGTVAGMIACVPGAALAKARLRAAAALVKAGMLDAPDVRRRAALAGQTLAKLAADDYYLSRIAVDPTRRGAGIGRELLHHFEQQAREAGARRLVLEVSPTHSDAIRLYERAGFTQTGRHDAHDADRTLVYHHMTKLLRE